MLIKSMILWYNLGICDLDWNDLRKYKNIINFLVFEASHKSNESPEEIATTLEVICLIENLETLRYETAHYWLPGHPQNHRLNHGPTQ